MSEAVKGARYVVGFMFDKSESEVLLIHKARPQWQVGRLNGVGDRIEDGESALQAMRREFTEEVGIEHDDWQEYCVLSDCREWSIHFFWAIGPVGEAVTLGDERPEVVKVDTLPPAVIPNLRWLIPMALTMKYDRADCFQVTELVR